jgi:hypothetical protein
VKKKRKKTPLKLELEFFLFFSATRASKISLLYFVDG